MEGSSNISEVDYEKARSLCGEVLCGPWTQQDNITTRLLTGGVLNKVIVCSLKKGHDEHGRDKVLVRLFATNLGETEIGEAVQAVAFEAFHRAGLGPKLLGAFNGGRIEEFVPSRMSNYKDARTQDGLRVVARLTARMHGLVVPMKQNPNVFIANTRSYYLRTRSERTNLDVAVFPVDLQVKLRQMLQFDVVSELEHVVETMKKVRSRVVLTHFDHHANNLIIKEGAKRPLTEADVMVIDMDVITMYYRGLDIGCYLYESSFDYANIGNIQFVDLLPEQSWRDFIGFYLEAWREHNPTKFDPEIDNVDNVMIEARLLSTVFSLAWVDFVLEKLNNDNSIVESIRGFINVVADYRIPFHFQQKALALELLNARK